MAAGVPVPRLGELLADESVDLHAGAATQDDAIRHVGGLLAASGAIADGYAEAMLEREASVGTYVGEGIAIPHATFAGKEAVHRDALAVAVVPDGVPWGSDRVTVVIAIAARGRRHIGLLSRLARTLLEPGVADRLRAAGSAEEVRAVLDGEADRSTP